MGETKSAQTLPKTLPGTVCKQYVRCGKPNCHCAKAKSLHGPYFYRFYRTEGRLRKQYVRREDEPRIRAACAGRIRERRALRASKARCRALLRIIREAEGLWRRR